MENRREIQIRHARFNAALIVATVYNAHRGPDSPGMSPFDLIAGVEDEDPEEAERRKYRNSVKNALRVAFTERKFNSPEEVQAEKTKTIARMKASGVTDAEEVFREVWPEL